MNKIIVVGGGASGLLASICASNDKNEVILLEKEKTCGKKILISGNGRCNYFNNDFKIDYYYSDDIDILSEIININNKRNILKLLNSIGIVPRIKDNLYYPYSNQSVSVKNTLIEEALSRRVNIKEEICVLDIEKNDDKFTIKTNNGNFYCDKVIFSGGSRAYIKSDYSGYDILKKLGHKINPVLPGLTGFYSDTYNFKDISGVRCEGKVSLYIDNKFVKEEIGNIQFTDYGVSGICIFNLSLIASKALYENKKVSLKINFMPEFEFNNEEELVDWLNNRNELIGRKSISFILDSVLNYKLSNIILKSCKIDGFKSFDKFTLDEKKKLASYILSFNISINKVNNFSSSQVCRGGVTLKDIDINTMESKIVKGLYITGEVLDVCGICGGYNLGFAFLSGMIAGHSVRRIND